MRTNVKLSSITSTERETKTMVSPRGNSLMPLKGSSIENRVIIQCRRNNYFKFNMSSIFVLISFFLAEAYYVE